MKAGEEGRTGRAIFQAGAGQAIDIPSLESLLSVYPLNPGESLDAPSVSVTS